MQLTIPELVLVVLMGPSGAGKSTFAQRHFRPTEVLSSDACRALVADSETDQAATPEAFELLHFIAAKRLPASRLTVIDATNVQSEARRPLLALAREHHCLAVVIVFDLPADVCQAHNRQRADRNFTASVIHRQIQQLKHSLRSLKREGFRYVYTFSSPEDVGTATVERQPLWNNRRYDHGPFNIIGDVHGCCDELEQLMKTLGYVWAEPPTEVPGLYRRIYCHPEGRKAIFVGDLVDRGPRILDTYQLVRHMVDAGNALCVPGNHEAKLMRKLRGRDVVVNHGLEQTLADIKHLPGGLRERVGREMADFSDGLISHYVLDDGQLVIVCRDEAATQRRFGIVNGGMGICYTRTGRPFFADQSMEDALLAHIQSALTDAGFWEAFETDWVCLDGELMPWSLKAQGLLRQQYAPVGAAGQAAYATALAALRQAAERGVAVEALASRYRERAAMVARYAEAYQRFCCPVHSVEDLRLAPFHLLATEGAVHVDKTHQWHLDTLGRIVSASSSPCLQMTASRVLDLTDTSAGASILAWRDELTEQGGEGMVVKPLDFIARGRRGLAQPAMKCRGRDYLRLIYGPEYTAPEHLARLRVRHLGVKRALALREFALGIEALERFVRREPLRRVHACVFSVLALESEAVDPRL